MLSVVDGIGRSVSLAAPPERIVSLVPSTTETLFALGLGDRVVGVTRYCVHPRDSLDHIVKIGGTKELEAGRVEALEPDLLIGNAEENTREMFEQLEARWPLYVAFPKTVDEAIEDLETMGVIVGAASEAAAVGAELRAARTILHAARRERSFRYAYLIWREPWMVASGDTFIAAMLAEAGGVNAFAEATGEGPGRYPTVRPADLADPAIDRVLLSSEPFPFKEKHAAELVAAGVPREKIQFVDGELCSWHGVRMGRAFRSWARSGFLEQPAELDLVE